MVVWVKHRPQQWGLWTARETGEGCPRKSFDRGTARFDDRTRSKVAMRARLARACPTPSIRHSPPRSRRPESWNVTRHARRRTGAPYLGRVSHLGDIEIIGHRGYTARAPENTIASIEAALAAGARAVEFDVQVASCGTPVVIHDDTLDRTTDGEGPVSWQTVEQLRRLDGGAWFDPEFTGERIPTLTEALDHAADRAHHVYPEVKGIREPSDVDRMVRMVQDRAMSDRATFISIDWSILARVRARDAAIRLGFIVVSADLFDEALSLATADPAAILDLNHEIVLDEPSVVRRAKDEGVDVVTWTVNEPDEATQLRRAGVTGFTTDHVHRLLAWAGQELE